MEVIVPCCVGLLTAISVGSALPFAGCLVPAGAFWVDRVQRGLKGTAEHARRAYARCEAWLFEHGVLTPRKRSERQRVERAMPEAFGTLAVSLGSGLSLAQAMQYVGGRAEEPVKTEFLHASSLMTCGVPASEALDELVSRLRAPGLELVTLALKVSRRTGAPLGGLLGDAAHVVGERIGLERRLEVKTAQVRMSARLVAGMPVVMVAFLSLVSGDFRAGVLTGAGMGSLAIATSLNIVAWVVIRRVMRIEP